MTSEAKPRWKEFLVEKKLKGGVNRAFDPDNVDMPGDAYWKVIEHAAFQEAQAEVKILRFHLEAVCAPEPDGVGGFVHDEFTQPEVLAARKALLGKSGGEG